MFIQLTDVSINLRYVVMVQKNPDGSRTIVLEGGTQHKVDGSDAALIDAALGVHGVFTPPTIAITLANEIEHEKSEYTNGMEVLRNGYIDGQ